MLYFLKKYQTEQGGILTVPPLRLILCSIISIIIFLCRIVSQMEQPPRPLILLLNSTKTIPVGFTQQVRSIPRINKVQTSCYRTFIIRTQLCQLLLNIQPPIRRQLLIFQRPQHKDSNRQTVTSHRRPGHLASLQKIASHLRVVTLVQALSSLLTTVTTLKVLSQNTRHVCRLAMSQQIWSTWSHFLNKL